MVAQVCPQVLVSWACRKDVPFILDNRLLGKGLLLEKFNFLAATEFATSAPLLAQGGFVVAFAGASSDAWFRVSGSYDVQAVTT
jgi:hypothetical protein